jgi:hypothetical protein
MSTAYPQVAMPGREAANGKFSGPLVRLARRDVRDHINCRKNDRWRSYRFCRALPGLKSPMRYIREIFGAPRFSSFSTQSARSRHSSRGPPSPVLTHSDIGTSLQIYFVRPLRTSSKGPAWTATLPHSDRGGGRDATTAIYWSDRGRSDVVALGPGAAAHR